MFTGLQTTFAGVRIFSSPLAIKIVHRIGKHPIRKRRRGWTVVKVEEPCAFRFADGAMCLHPTLFQQFQAIARKENLNG